MRRLLLLLFVMMSACVPTAPPVVTPMPPEPITRLAGVTVRGEQGENLPRLSGVLTPDTGPTTPCVVENLVRVSCETTASGGGSLHLEAVGYDPRDVRVSIDTNNSELTLAVSFHPLPRLVKRTQEFFGLETGERFSAIEASAFDLCGRELRGQDIEATLTDYQGFNLLRVWTVYDVTFRDGNHIHLIPAEDPNYYDKLAACVHHLAQHHFYVELTAFTGASRLLPSLGQQQSHLDHIAAIARQETNVLVETGNEYEQGDNRWLFEQLVYPGDILLSGGSAGTLVWPTALGLPTLSYAEYHNIGSLEWQRRSGHEAWEMANDVGVPVLTNESTRPDQDGDANHFYDAFRACKLLNAGCAFHSASGRLALPFTPADRPFAQAALAGSESMPLECQDAGGYVHRQDLEPANVMRTYQRGNNPDCIAVIHR